MRWGEGFLRLKDREFSFSRGLWAQILDLHLDDRRKNDYHRSDVGRDGRIVRQKVVPPRTLLEQLKGRRGPREFKGGAADWNWRAIWKSIVSPLPDHDPPSETVN